MDNKIKYVDLNGLKVFAEDLKQYLKNHVVELGLYQELLHRIENLGLHNAMLNVTYSELKSLRDNSQLVPGRQYRITDYVTTTTQSNTQSAGHRFDVIVIADDVNVLNENARAIQHVGDNYFSNSDLNTWELKYCLDNGTDRFAWADDSEDYTINLPLSDSIRNLLQQYFGDNAYIPGVITFKYWNHRFNDPNCEEWMGIDYYAATNVNLPGDNRLLIAYPHGTKLYSNIAFSETLSIAYNYDIEGNCFFINGQVAPDLGPIDTLPTVLIEEKGKGVIYYMKDEFNNECSYDFKNITFKVDGSYRWTFHGIRGDKSLKQEYRCELNVIKPYWNSSTKKFTLNNNVFIDENVDYDVPCVGNIIEENCYNNKFGSNIVWNRLGPYSDGNTFGNEIKHNTTLSRFSNNTLGNEIHHNSFGTQVKNNTLGNYIEHCQFGNGCITNLLASYSRNVIFENGVYRVQLNGPNASEDNYLQNYTVCNGLNEDNSTTEKITCVRNAKYATYVGKDSSGVIRTFCLADMFDILNQITIKVEE